MTRRTEKVSALLKREIGSFMQALDLPSLATISKVEVTQDLKWTKIWITVMGSAAEADVILKTLSAKAAGLQRDLNKKLTMKFVPRISFVLDHGEEYASHVNELLRKTYEQ